MSGEIYLEMEVFFIKISASIAKKNRHTICRFFCNLFSLFFDNF